jgi:carboxyl-terminal processing protease
MNTWFSKYKISILASLLVVGASFFCGVYVGFNGNMKSIAGANLENKDPGLFVKADFAPFWKAWNVLNERHVDYGSSTTNVSDQEKVWGAIEGLTNSFKDPYTVFFPPADSEIFENDISGNFQGVGMEIGMRDGVLTVIAPLKGTPAQKAGILAGDKILKIDNTPTNTLNSDEAVKLIRGKGGTKVVFTIFRAGSDNPIEISVIRATIDIPTIKSYTRLDGVFVIELYNFSAVSTDLFRKALREFVASKTNKLVLDLRGNPGGYLEASIDMASWFLPLGEVIVRENFGKDKEEVVHRSKGYNIFNNKLKMVILMDGGSASASEILAGSLQENGIATLVGTNSFGKGSVQELVKITPDTSLKVTIARWLTPKGKSISDGGLKPDIEVKRTPEEIVKGIDPQMKAAVELLLKK